MKNSYTYNEWVVKANEEAHRLASEYRIDYKIVFADLIHRYNGVVLE